MLTGAGLLVDRGALPVQASAASIVVGTWLVAIAVGWLARRVLPLRGPHTTESLFAPSIVVPSVGIALMLPLTLHLPIALAKGVGTEGFDEWVKLSIWISGATHVVLAILVAVRGSQLVTGKLPPLSISTIYLITVLVSCVPFVLFVLPPIIVMVTGLAFIPLLRYQATLVARERAELGVEAATPQAIAYA